MSALADFHFLRPPWLLALFVLPLACYAYIIYYGFSGSRPADAAASTGARPDMPRMH